MHVTHPHRRPSAAGSAVIALLVVSGGQVEATASVIPTATGLTPSNISSICVAPHFDRYAVGTRDGTLHLSRLRAPDNTSK